MKMHKQTMKAKMDEHLGMKDGKESMKKQTMKDRRHEMEGMKKEMPKKKMMTRSKKK
jgi:hypothetical protein